MLLISLISFVTLTYTAQGLIANSVKVSVYYDSLCMDSIRFFKEQLQPTYTAISEIMIVEIYANGFETEILRPGGTGYLFLCQHGLNECYGNKVLECGQKYITDHEVYLNFAFCVMGATYPPSSGAQCASQVGVNYDVIEKCANSTEGEIVLHDVGIIQNQLNPTVTWVPWIIINDVFNDDDLHSSLTNLKVLVCATYSGKPPPECLAPFNVNKVKEIKDLVTPSVNVTVFYETLCANCMKFFKHQLQPTYEQLSDVIQLDIYAYGKEKETETNESYAFLCEHGPDECYVNKVLGCGRKLINNHSTYLSFAFCVMSSDYLPNFGSECSSKFGIPYSPIEKCANSTEGDIVLHDEGVVQLTLAPDLHEVPWIIINGNFSKQQNREAITDLRGLLCKTYTGQLPPPCHIIGS